MKTVLREIITPEQVNAVIESREDNGKKHLYMKGICIQGDIKNANQRIYPVREISNAVKTMTEQLKGGYSILGEVDHPDDLKINLDRVSHMITEMWMEGPNGHGKLKILSTPMGKLIETMLESGVKLGVSSRGSGNVDESSGHVHDFEIITVDIVAQPSAQNAYPVPIYESMMNRKHGYKTIDLLKDSLKDAHVQKYLKEEVIKMINDLKLR